MSPRHHGQNSTLPGEPAGEVRRPRTFSITTRQGRRASTARATCSHRPERVWELSPARRPATETSLTGEARRQDAHPGDVGPVDGRDVAQVGHPGPVPGQDARGARIDLRMPGQAAAEHGLHPEVQPAVPGAERADQRRAHAAGPHVTAPARSGPVQPLPAWQREVRVGEQELWSWTGYGRLGAVRTEAKPSPMRREGSRRLRAGPCPPNRERLPSPALLPPGPPGRRAGYGDARSGSGRRAGESSPRGRTPPRRQVAQRQRSPR